ncbi:MAG: DUF3261 domain-containing protein [Magnetovibrionaceae bacterium]
MILATLMLSACAHDSSLVEAPPAALAEGVGFVLPAWTPPGRAVEAQQALDGAYGDQHFSFLARVSVTAERLHLAALDGLGRRAFEITWAEAGISAKRADWIPQSLDPRHILAHMVMAYWPMEILRNATVQLAGSTDRIVWTETDAGRRLDQGGRALLILDRPDHSETGWTGQVSIRNLAMDYAITVTSQELSAPETVH